MSGPPNDGSLNDERPRRSRRVGLGPGAAPPHTSGHLAPAPRWRYGPAIRSSLAARVTARRPATCGHSVRRPSRPARAPGPRGTGPGTQPRPGSVAVGPRPQLRRTPARGRHRPGRTAAERGDGGGGVDRRRSRSAAVLPPQPASESDAAPARLESEGYPAQRADLCIQTLRSISNRTLN
jgi:hypothetical protein